MNNQDSSAELGTQLPEQPNSPIQQRFMDYLTPTAYRKGNISGEIGSLLLNDDNRAVFTQEWAHAVQSAKDLDELYRVTSLAFDPHQDGKLADYLKLKIISDKPGLKSVFENSRPGEIPFNPEYDIVRKAVGEKLQGLGLTNAGIQGGKSALEYIFAAIHPNPWQDVPYTTYRTEKRGIILKREVRIPVEGHFKKLRPYEELLRELLQSNQSRQTSS